MSGGKVASTDRRQNDRPCGSGALNAALAQLAESPVLLVASDYDGTLSPIVADPARAAPDPRAIDALVRLAAMPRTHVAIISGRALRQLSELIGRTEFSMVGSHGSEFGPDFARTLPAEAQSLRDQVARELEAIAASAPGFLVEIKPASAAFHYRNSSDHDAQHALREILAGPAKRPGVLTHHGKRVVELAVVEASKGHAIEVLRRELSPAPDAVFFAGDDLTDETAFAALRPGRGDLGVKVGPADLETRAEHRVEGTQDVAELLSRLADLRARFL
jgi:trehalose 6-phosphate phosphatase